MFIHFLKQELSYQTLQTIFPVFAQIPDLISQPKSTVNKLTHNLTSENVRKLLFFNLSIIDWFEVLVLQDSNKSFDLFMEILTHIYDETIPFTDIEIFNL